MGFLLFWYQSDQSMGMTVSERVGELEGRMAGLQEGLESVKAEVMRYKISKRIWQV